MSERILHVTGWLTTIAALLLLSACGPVTSSSAVSDAEAAIAAAEKENAHRFAAFSYWSSVNYLEKAKQVEGYSEFGPATDFAIKSLELALRSVEETKEFHHQEKLRRERLKKSKSGKRPGTKSKTRSKTKKKGGAKKGTKKK